VPIEQVAPTSSTVPGTTRPSPTTSTTAPPGSGVTTVVSIPKNITVHQADGGVSPAVWLPSLAAIGVVVISTVANLLLTRATWSRQARLAEGQAKEAREAATREATRRAIADHAAWKRDRRFETYSTALLYAADRRVKIAVALDCSASNEKIPADRTKEIEEYRGELARLATAAFALEDVEIGEHLQAISQAANDSLIGQPGGRRRGDELREAQGRCAEQGQALNERCQRLVLAVQAALAGPTDRSKPAAS